MTKNLYKQFLEGCEAPTGGGSIETRNEIYDAKQIMHRVDLFGQRIARTSHPFVGVETSDPVAFLVALYACSKTGRVCVPLSSRDPIRTDHILQTLAIDLVIDGETDQHIDVNSSDKRIALDGFEPGLVANSIVLLFTSGTTSSRSKGVFMGQHGVGFVCQRMNEVMQVDFKAREYVLAGIDHAFGFGRCHSVLMAGGQVILPNTLDLRELFGQFETRRCNGLAAVPSLLSVMLDQVSSLDAKPFQGLKYIQTGAMRFSGPYRRKLASNSSVRAYLHYGLTEAMRATFLDVQSFPDKLMTEGRPFEGVEVTIQDPDGNLLPVGSTGEVCVKGPTLALGYTDQKRWANVMRGGWFHTGDMGLVDNEGFLEYRGRSADAMNINGNLVYPDDIEERLRPIFGTMPFSVFGIADQRGIKDDLLYIAYEGPACAISLVECADLLKKLGFAVLPEGISAVSELPRNATGKVQRFKLREMFSRAGPVPQSQAINVSGSG